LTSSTRQDVVDLVAGVEEHLPLGRLDLLELGAIDPVNARLLSISSGKIMMNLFEAAEHLVKGMIL